MYCILGLCFFSWWNSRRKCWWNTPLPIQVPYWNLGEILILSSSPPRNLFCSPPVESLTSCKKADWTFTLWASGFPRKFAFFPQEFFSCVLNVCVRVCLQKERELFCGCPCTRRHYCSLWRATFSQSKPGNKTTSVGFLKALYFEELDTPTREWTGSRKTSGVHIVLRVGLFEGLNSVLSHKVGLSSVLEVHRSQLWQSFFVK